MLDDAAPMCEYSGMITLKQIKQRLKRKGVSIPEMSKRSGVSERTLIYLRDTDRDPRYSTVVKLDKYFNSI